MIHKVYSVRVSDVYVDIALLSEIFYLESC